MASLLLVDDDLDMADTLADILRREGHSVRLAHDGREGMARIEDSFPDLIVCDVEMPNLTGPDMAYRIFLRDAGAEKIPIILISGVPDLREVAAKVGTKYFLSKPVSVERLFAMLTRALVERVPPQPRV